MFDKLLEKIRRVDKIESKLLSIFEGKSWEYIAKALYQIVDDISTADDMCKEDVKAFRNAVMRLQAKKNKFLYSPDGYSIQKVHECVCHIYGLSDEKLLEFYGSMGDDWNAFNEPYGSDKAEVKRELEKRGLEIPVKESLTPKQEEVLKRAKLGKEYNAVELHTDIRTLRALVNKGYLLCTNPRSYIHYGGTKGVHSPETVSKFKLKENLAGHARRELELAGMFDKEVEGSEAAGSWNILCAEAVMELMEVFAEQGHSGFSASMTQDLFSRLSKFEALTELTDNSDEWNDISEMQSGEPGWQNSRNPSCFSEDGGKTYWDISEDYYLREDEEDGMVYSGSLSTEEWKNRPIHQSKHIEKKE